MGKIAKGIGDWATQGGLVGMAVHKLLSPPHQGPAPHAPDIASVLGNRPMKTPFGGGDLGGTYLGNIGTPAAKGKTLLG